MQKIDFLNKFIGANNPDMISMCKHLALKFFEKNQTIFKEGEMGENFYIIISGKVEIYVEKFNEEKKVKEKKVFVELGSGGSVKIKLKYN